MNPTSPSFAYRLAKWRLSKPPSKFLATLFAIPALVHFALALANPRLAVFNAVIAAGFLASAYSEWELVGFREILSENAAPHAAPPAGGER